MAMGDKKDKKNKKSKKEKENDRPQSKGAASHMMALSTKFAKVGNSSGPLL